MLRGTNFPENTKRTFFTSTPFPRQGVYTSAPFTAYFARSSVVGGRVGDVNETCTQTELHAMRGSLYNGEMRPGSIVNGWQEEGEKVFCGSSPPSSHVYVACV